MLLLVSTFAPLALFKLLAFVDPGTSSGAAMRSGMAAVGGVQGLLGGGAASARGGVGCVEH
jgi:type IV secretion system protein TrbL